jgi:hypothetical protein
MDKFIINEEEKNRILGLHKSQIISEQGSADINMDRVNRQQLNKAPIKIQIDAKNNPNWKKIKDKLIPMGFTVKGENISTRLSSPNPIDTKINFYRETLTHGKDKIISLEYPLSMLDYTGNFYPEYVEIDYGMGSTINVLMPFKGINNKACTGELEQYEDAAERGGVKIQCVDYIMQIVNGLLKK